MTRSRITGPMQTLLGSMIALTAGCWLPSQAHGQDVQLEETALAIAPADAAFFATFIDMRQGWDEFVNGSFVARLRSVAFVQDIESELLAQWENPAGGELAQAKAALQNPNVRNLLKLAEDMFSQEAFVYGGDDWTQAIEGLMQFQNDISQIAASDPEAIEAYFNNLTAADLESIRVPTTVVGFRLSEDKNARLQLDALEGIIRLAGMQADELKPFLQRLKRADLKDGQTLSIRLDTDLIPMDILDDQQRPRAEKIAELLEGRSIALAVGVKSNMLLMAFGEEDTIINELGNAPESLLDHPQMDVLKAADTSRVRTISFVSERWMESQYSASLDSYFQRIAQQFTGAMKDEFDSDASMAQWQSEIMDDAAAMDDAMSQLKPDFGPAVTWSAATSKGSEGYAYNWTQNAMFENTSPMSILNYAGESPLILFGYKAKQNPYAEDFFELMLERLPKHVRRFIQLVEDDEDDQQKALLALDKGWPLLRDAFDILRNKIGPSLGENESLLVGNAQWSTTTLGPNAPQPDQALPLPEFALACKVTNRDLFLNGCVEMYGLFDQAVDLLREIDENSVPSNYSVPRPDEETVAGGTRYYYRQFDELSLLEGFRPQLVITDDVLVVGYSARQVGDMLNARPLRSRPAWLTPQTPVAAVSFLDWSTVIRSGRPWLEFGLSLASPDMDQPLSYEPGPIPTGNDVLEIYDCMTALGKAAATVTVEDNGPTVTRWVWESE